MTKIEVINGRYLKIPSDLRRVNVQNDENAQHVEITCPRYYDGTDLSQYAMYLKTVSVHGRDDILLTQTVTADTITAVWTLQPPQTSYKGSLTLTLYFAGEGFKWETMIAEIDINLSPDAEAVVPATPSAYEQWLVETQAIADEAAHSADGAAEAAAQSARDAAAASSSAYRFYYQAQSASGDAAASAQWARGMAQAATAAVGKTSHIGDNGNWFEWDAETNAFVDTGVQAQGEQGEQGVQGIQGARGERGEQGVQGIQGERGEQGERGLTGEAGADGQNGRDGVDGQDGAAGVTFTPSVSTEGDISWTNDGGLPNPPSVNINGQDGVGVPAGGTTGQVLKKASDTDHDTEWANESGGGGGDTWRRIGKITTAEDCAAITFTTDEDGNAFALKRFRVALWLTPAATPSAAWLRLLLNNGTWGANSFLQTTAVASLYHLAYEFEVEKIGDTYRFSNFMQGIQTQSAAPIVKVSTSPYLHFVNQPETQTSPISSVSLCTYGDALIGANTECWLWGINA